MLWKAASLIVQQACYVLLLCCVVASLVAQETGTTAHNHQPWKQMIVFGQLPASKVSGYQDILVHQKWLCLSWLVAFLQIAVTFVVHWVRPPMSLTVIEEFELVLWIKDLHTINDVFTLKIHVNAVPKSILIGTDVQVLFKWPFHKQWLLCCLQNFHCSNGISVRLVNSLPFAIDLF